MGQTEKQRRDEVHPIYFMELRFQCDSFLDAQRRAEQLVGEIRSNGAPVGERQNRLFFAVSHAVNAAAMVSKLLQPPEGPRAKPRSSRRGRALRERLEVGPDHPLLSRKLRNVLEHFDERLDDAVRTGRPLVDRNLEVDSYGRGIVGVPRNEFLRYIEVDGQQITVSALGEVVVLGDLAVSIRDLKQRAARELEPEGYWW